MKTNEAREAVAQALVDKLQPKRTVEAQYERALGKLAMRVSLLHFFLERYAWKMWGVEDEIGKILTANLQISALIEKLKASADHSVLPVDKNELVSILKGAGKAIVDRNELLHSLWIINDDGEPVSCVSRKKGVLPEADVPTVKVITDLNLSVLRSIGDFLHYIKRTSPKPPPGLFGL